MVDFKLLLYFFSYIYIIYSIYIYVFDIFYFRIFIPSVFALLFIIYYLKKFIVKSIIYNNLTYLFIIFSILFIVGSFYISSIDEFNILIYLESILYMVFGAYCLTLLIEQSNKNIIILPFCVMILVIGKHYTKKN